MNINEKTTLDWLTYANAVIKSRAISNVEDNMKPVHRRILYAMHELKLKSTGKTVKSAKVVGAVLGSYHPHGDISVYEALIRLAQPWKTRYPLVIVQGNKGNKSGDGAAAQRYTECKLSPYGEYMLEDIDKNCIDWKPNYDNSLQEPSILPGMFPNLLCNGGSGIAVGISTSLLPHNFNEIAEAIKLLIKDENCSLENIMKIVPGPDFPTGGIVTNGEELYSAYQTGRGTVRLESKYHIETSSGKNTLVFTEIPYLINIEEGIIKPLQKLVREEGYDMFENVLDYTDENSVEIRIVLSKGTDINTALAVLMTKTRLATTLKINNTVIKNNQPVTLSFIDLLKSYVEHRHDVITRIALDDDMKYNKKLNILLGIQKCLSNIDLLISSIREAPNRAVAKAKIVELFELNDEQAEAILEMKLARLSKLDIIELENDIEKYKNKIKDVEDIINNKSRRETIITQQLESMKDKKDVRCTEIRINAENLPIEEQTEKDYFVTSTGLEKVAAEQSIKYLKARSPKEIVLYDKDGTFNSTEKIIGGFVKEEKPLIVCVTKNGYIKVTESDEYNLNRKMKSIKLKDGDELIFADMASTSDYVIILDKENRISKLSLEEFSVVGKLSLGVKSGLNILSIMIASDKDYIMFVDKDNKGKITSVQDLCVNTRLSNGQVINENNVYMVKATNRDEFYVVNPKKVVTLSKDKMSIKSKTATGANISTKTILNIL